MRQRQESIPIRRTRPPPAPASAGAGDTALHALPSWTDKRTKAPGFLGLSTHSRPQVCQ